MHKIMIFVIPILALLIFVFAFTMIFSSKMRGKLFSRQIKSLKYMIDESKDDLEALTQSASDIYVDVNKNILNKHEESLKNINKRNANIKKDGVEIIARAIKDGLTEETKYCKYCGDTIDIDSIYCKSCGRKQ